METSLLGRNIRVRASLFGNLSCYCCNDSNRDSGLNSVVGLVIQRYEETLAELKRIQEACTAMEDARDEMSVFNMVSSAISAGVIKALEHERDEAIASLNLQFKAILKRMQGEFRSSRER